MKLIKLFGIHKGKKKKSLGVKCEKIVKRLAATMPARLNERIHSFGQVSLIGYGMRLKKSQKALVACPIVVPVKYQYSWTNC